MKPISIFALLLSVMMLTPNLAQAERNMGNAYIPSIEKSLKKKAKKKKTGKKKAAASKKRKTGAKKKKATAKKKTGKRMKKKNQVVRHAPRKKSKSRKFKKLVKKSLRIMGDYALQDAYRVPPRGVRARRPYGYDYGGPVCLPKPLIRARLIDRGWHNFELINRGPHRVRLRATNFKGRRFRLVIDRCDGHIIKRRPIRQYWSYGY